MREGEGRREKMMERGEKGEEVEGGEDREGWRRG